MPLCDVIQLKSVVEYIASNHIDSVARRRRIHTYSAKLGIYGDSVVLGNYAYERTAQ